MASKKKQLQALGFKKIIEVVEPKDAVKVTRENSIELCNQINSTYPVAVLKKTDNGIEWRTASHYKFIYFGDWIVLGTKGVIESIIAENRFERSFRVVDD